jgi:hypothetical protein
MLAQASATTPRSQGRDMGAILFHHGLPVIVCLDEPGQVV